MSIKTHDFRSEFMGLRYPDEPITEEGIINFTQSLFGDDDVKLDLEVRSEPVV